MHTLLKLHMTVPVTTATAERTFSINKDLPSFEYVTTKIEPYNTSSLLPIQGRFFRHARYC